MSGRSFAPRAVPVPAGQMQRLTRLSGLAAGIAGRAVLGGGRALVSGRRPALPDLLLTADNAARITEHLAQMRGAAMKIGQLMSMEAGDMLPPELAAILAHLRADAHFMPPGQLKDVLSRAWGPGFQRRFRRFETRPLAAASIGQVHRAVTACGRDLAIKVQYPGVKRSIDADVRNVGLLIRMSGLLPRGVDLEPLLQEARAQLHDEADYAREGAALARFGAHLADDPDFLVPGLCAEFTTDTVLAMDFVDSRPVEDLARDAPQQVRDRVADRLIRLMLRELFDLGDMQTDPNFANYRYQPDTGRIVLLDFGAVRRFAPGTGARFARLLRAGLADDRAEIRAAMEAVGLFGPAGVTPAQETLMLDLFATGMEVLRAGTPHDFARCDLAERLRDKAVALAGARDFAPVPPIDTLFIQRKVAGLYLLARRLRSRVDLMQVTAPHAGGAV